MSNLSKKLIPYILLICASFSFFKLYEADNNLISYVSVFKKTPVFITKPYNSNGELIFISHGFAGSSNFMRSIAITLAQAGHIVIRFDYLGHGSHPIPYSGSINSINKITNGFIEQTDSIIDNYLEFYKKESAFLIGHSMASDIVIQTALGRDDIKGVIGISTYSNSITKTGPKNLLILNGEWETKLRNKAIQNLKTIGIDEPRENILYGSLNVGNARKIISINDSDHVRILYSNETQKFIHEWISEISGNNSNLKTNQIGVFMSLTLVSLFLFFISFIRVVPSKEGISFNINLLRFLIISICATLITPVFLKFFVVEFTNITAHNYLINHLLLYSFFLLLLVPTGSYKKILKSFNLNLFLLTTIFSLFIFGGIIDCYISTFFPTKQRLALTVLMMLGCLPLMILLQIFYANKINSLLMGNISKLFFILSLSIAIIFNPQELFLLGYVVFLFITFSLTFGFLTNALNQKSNNLLSAGISNGIALSWTLAIAIPTYISEF